MRLKDILERKKCFKLICGAGNQNLEEISRLVAIYAAAGCHFFDFAADEQVLKAAQRGLDFAISEDKQIDYHFCISVGSKNDVHFNKAKINPQKCVQCSLCSEKCPQNAIQNNYVIEKNCIGCLSCKSACKSNAIEIYQKDKLIDLSTFKLFNLSCVELHVSDEKSGIEMWDELCLKNFEMLSICISRKAFSDNKISEILSKMVAKRTPYSTIIQADGNPMSGSKDDIETTLPAVETGIFIKSLNLPVYLILSGGTNSQTAKLCKEKELETQGIAFGTYARKLVKKHIERSDFWENEAIFEDASTIAKNLTELFTT